MQDNQEKVLKHLMRFYANHLLDRLRSIHNWEPEYLPSDPESYLLVGKSYLDRKVDYYRLDFIFYNVERQTCPTPIGQVLVPSVKLRLLHRPTDISSPYKEVLNSYVFDLQTVCPHHLQPHKYFTNCQHQCILGWMLRDTHSPFVADYDGYRLNSREGYQFEHGQLIIALLEACTLRKMDDTPTSWEYIS